jgi:methionyl-tRNA formyltransferase
MRIIFIGQAPFGGESLENLIAQGEEIVGVITIPDAPNQRHPNPVKQCAEQHAIPLFQSKLLKKPEAISWVRQLKPDLLVLAFVTAFVPQEMIDIAPLGGINYHPSLLPKYRGGSAINWAIINGETETGVTIHFIDEGVDTGPILLQEKVSIEPDDTVKSVYFDKLYPMGIRMISNAVQLIREGKAMPTLQDESSASFQPVITTDDTVIDWSQPTDKVYNLIRGANPAPGAVTSFRGQSCKIFDVKLAAGSGSAGTILSVDQTSFTVATGNGAIVVQSIQPSKRKKQPAQEFISLNKVREGDRFGS